MCRSAHLRLPFPLPPGSTRLESSVIPTLSHASGRRSSRSGSCPWPPRKAVPLAQRIIEMLIGRLITDEQFRSEFLRDPENTLLGLCDRGLELSRTEVAALVNTDPAVWARTADAIDPRLQKASLKNEAGMQ